MILVFTSVFQQDYAETTVDSHETCWEDVILAKKEPIKIWGGSGQTCGSRNFCL